MVVDVLDASGPHVSVVRKGERRRHSTRAQLHGQAKSREGATEPRLIFDCAAREDRSAHVERAECAACMERPAAGQQRSAVNPVEREVPDEREPRHVRGIYCAS